jgi:uncharacterized membrane protein
MTLRLATEAAGLVMVALSIFAHAWISRLSPQPAVNFIGWIVVVLTTIVFGANFIHCG